MPVAPFLIKKNEVKAVQIRTKSEKQNQRFENRKSPENRMVPGFLNIFELVCRACYLLENCGARRAALRPYFLRSFIRESRVTNPAAFSAGR